MKKATLRLLMSAVAMLGIAATQLDVTAFAQEPLKVKMSVKIPTTFNLPIAKPAIRWSDRPSDQATSQAKGGGKKKWILLAAIGAGGATVAYLATHKEETPSITVGTPTIGLQFGRQR